MAEPNRAEASRDLARQANNSAARSSHLGTAFAAVLVSFVVLGLPVGILGTAWPSIRSEFSRTDSGLAVLLAGFTVGYTISSAISGHLSDRIGSSRLLSLAIATSATGIVAIVASPGFIAMVAAHVILGIGNGFIDSVANTWTALTRGPRSMGMLHAAFGVGATIGPVLTAGLVSRGSSWRWPFLILIGGQIVALAMVVSSRRSLDNAPRRSQFVTKNVAAVPPPRRLPTLMLAWFAVYLSVEVAVGQWGYTLLTEGRGMSKGTAGLLVAAYWGGLTIGRFILGAIGHLVQPERLMTATSALAVTMAGLLWLDPAGVGAAVFPIIGLAFAPMFPLMVNRTPVYLGPDRSSRAVGYQLAASSLGFVTTPLLIGLLADHHGISVAPPVVFGATTVMVAVWLSVADASKSVFDSGERTGER